MIGLCPNCGDRLPEDHGAPAHACWVMSVYTTQDRAAPPPTEQVDFGASA